MSAIISWAYLSNHVDVRAMIPSEKNGEKQKKTHKFNMVRQIAYVYGNKEEDFHYISIRFTKKGIYTNPQALKFQKYP